MEVVTWAADKWANRQRLVIRADTERKFLVGTVGGPWFYSCSGVIKVYNAGPSRVTVNEGWFEAKDGTRVVAFVPRESSLTPGDPELFLTAPRDALTATHDEHGGIVKMCVLLAGADKPAEEKVRDGWIDKVRALQDRD